MIHLIKLPTGNWIDAHAIDRIRVDIGNVVIVTAGPGRVEKWTNESREKAELSRDYIAAQIMGAAAGGLEEGVNYTV